MRTVDDLLDEGRFGDPAWPLAVEAIALEQLAADGGVRVVDLAPDPTRGERPTVVAFLSADCFGCRPFWADLAGSSPSVLGERANVVVVADRSPGPAAATSRAPVVVAPGLGDRIGATLRPAFWILPDGDPTHSWCGSAATPTEVAVLADATARRATARTGDPSAIRTLVPSGQTATITLDGQTVVVHGRARTATALNASAAVIWHHLLATPAMVAGPDLVGWPERSALARADVAALVRDLERAGLLRDADRDEAPIPDRRWPRYVEPPRPCCGQEDPDPRERHGRIVVEVAGARRAIHVDDDRHRAELARRLAAFVVEDPRPRLDLVLEQHRPDPTVWAGSTVLWRNRDPAVLDLVLAGRLADLADVPDGQLGVAGTAWVGPGGALLLLGERSLADIGRRPLPAAGLLPVVDPVRIDPRTAELVVGDAWAQLDALAALAGKARRGAVPPRPPGVVPPGRYPIAAWHAPGHVAGAGHRDLQALLPHARVAPGASVEHEAHLVAALARRRLGRRAGR